MNVSRRADVFAYFYFFRTPNSREDIAFRSFRENFDFFEKNVTFLVKSGGTSDPTTIYIYIIIYSFNDHFWSSEWEKTSKYRKFLKITPKKRGIACSSGGVFHRDRALNNSTRSYLQNKKGLIKKYFF